MITELPDLPVAYQVSAPFLAAAETGRFGSAMPDDPGPYGDALAQGDDPPPR